MLIHCALDRCVKVGSPVNLTLPSFSESRLVETTDRFAPLLEVLTCHFNHFSAA
jgi:hypothetical protein